MECKAKIKFQALLKEKEGEIANWSRSLKDMTLCCDKIAGERDALKQKVEELIKDNDYLSEASMNKIELISRMKELIEATLIKLDMVAFHTDDEELGGCVESLQEALKQACTEGESVHNGDAIGGFCTKCGGLHMDTKKVCPDCGGRGEKVGHFGEYPMVECETCKDGIGEVEG